MQAFFIFSWDQTEEDGSFLLARYFAGHAETPVERTATAMNSPASTAKLRVRCRPNDYIWRPSGDHVIARTKRLIHPGITAEPVEIHVKLKEAVEICQGTLALNQRGKSPQDWATTQNNLGAALAKPRPF
jgi:hypothetical protein